jgi:hypothetical protein
MKTLNIIQPLRTHLKHLALTVAGAVLLTGSAPAEEMIVNVQFMRNGDNGASMTDIQGPVASADTTPTWNQLKANQYSNIGAGPYALVQADGSASGISLTLAGTRRADGWGPAGGEIPVFSGEAYMDGGAQTMTSLFSGLKTGATYDLYAMNSQGSSSDGYFTVNGNTAGRIRMRGAASPAKTFDGTTDWTSFITKTNDVDEPTSTANTAYFAELTPDVSGNLSVVLSYANTHNFGEEPFLGVAGFQLVQTSVPATTPVITAVGSPLAAMSTTYGTVSAEASFTVSGTDMLAGILVTSPAGFEVSQTSGSGFAPTTTVGAAGTIDSTTVYVRLAATAQVLGTYDSQNIVLSGGGAIPVNVATAASGNTVSPKPLTVTATGPAKPYGTTLVAGPSTTDFTAGATGVGSEVVTGVTLTPDSDGTSPTTPVGDTYVITPAAATGTGGFLASNYNITYTPYAGTVVIGTPTLSVTNTPVTYDGLSHAAVVTGSADGTVSDVKYDGSSEVPTADGTYAVTADFVPAEPDNYISLNDAPAGNFAIVKKEIMMVNVQFYDTANSSPSMTNLQGPVASYDPTPTWNKFTAAGWNFVIPTGGPETLVQADGSASGITLSMTGARRGGSWGGQGSNGIAVFGGGAYWDSGSDQTSTFSGLTPGVYYDLYVMNAAGSESDSRFTVNGNTAGAIRLRGTIDGVAYWNGSAWVGWSVDGSTIWTNFITTTLDGAGIGDPMFGATANTAYFKELTPDANGNLTIVMSHANYHRGGDFSPIAVAGYQLVQLPPQANMLSFGPGAVITGTAIAWTVPYPTTPEELKHLTPTFTLSADATCYDADPTSGGQVITTGTERDFTDPVHYWVKSSDGLITKDYIVTVTVAPPPPTPILVGTTPMPLTFDTLPNANQWATLSVSGAAADLTTDGDLDTAMSGIAASSINTQLASQAGSGALGTAYWRSDDQKLGTQPTGNAMTLLMATLKNDSGSTIDSLTISYTMGLASLTPFDDIKGHRVYWSKTGAAGTWTAVGDFLLAVPGTLNVSFDMPLPAWANGDLLYVVWADDNGVTNPDGDYTLDGLSFAKTTGGGYGTWANTNAPGQSPSEDYDNDGVENGIEYFMGQTGSSFTALPGLDASNTVSWPMSATYTGDYEVQTSPNLSTWTNVSPKPTPAGGNLTYTLPADAGKLFVRLVVTPN